MIVVTTLEIPGRRLTETLGLVRGSSIRARHIGRDVMAVFRNIAGGEIHEYTKMLAEAREQAIDRMLKEAEALGADAVVAVRFQTSMVMTGAAEMLCYGTAVKTVATEGDGTP
ncbi:MAG: YbjQ family protein [Longimicrobiales bacterium]